MSEPQQKEIIIISNDVSEDKIVDKLSIEYCENKVICSYINLSKPYMDYKWERDIQISLEELLKVWYSKMSDTDRLNLNNKLEYISYIQEFKILFICCVILFDCVDKIQSIFHPFILQKVTENSSFNYINLANLSELYQVSILYENMYLNTCGKTLFLKCARMYVLFKDFFKQYIPETNLVNWQKDFNLVLLRYTNLQLDKANKCTEIIMSLDQRQEKIDELNQGLNIYYDEVREFLHKSYRDIDKLIEDKNYILEQAHNKFNLEIAKAILDLKKYTDNCKEELDKHSELLKEVGDDKIKLMCEKADDFIKVVEKSIGEYSTDLIKYNGEEINKIKAAGVSVLHNIIKNSKK